MSIEKPVFLSGGMHFLLDWTEVILKEVRRPVGVVASIVPFNFPAMVPLWSLATKFLALSLSILGVCVRLEMHSIVILPELALIGCLKSADSREATDFRVMNATGLYGPSKQGEQLERSTPTLALCTTCVLYLLCVRVTSCDWKL